MSITALARGSSSSVKAAGKDLIVMVAAFDYGVFWPFFNFE
jgi:hypothetical protein